jgi:alpha-glucosidase (family GH31 glycosyl hydrolase)
MKNRIIKCAKAMATVVTAVVVLTFVQCTTKGNGKVDDTLVKVFLADSTCRTFDFYGDNIFRLFQDPQGGEMRDPVATPHAQILVDNPRRDVTGLTVKEKGGKTVMTTPRIKVEIDKSTGLITVTDRATKKVVFEETTPATIAEGVASMTVKAKENEYFYGGGMQNGRFSHSGKVIQIINSNNWVDGGVASPNPFYWSTGGYGVMWHTFKKGVYDFNSEADGTVKMKHDGDYIDLFVMVDKTPVTLLNDYYQLTGNPVLLPKFGFYEGHLNAYNRDYWIETDKGGVPFEDGKNYRESQKNNGGVRESLNGERSVGAGSTLASGDNEVRLPGTGSNYQFSARAVIDRYAAHDMPLGWILPNDGYGAGYGQTGSLEGNVENLRQFGEYAREHGVEVGLWTQSDLYPKEDVEPLLQRDIIREVRDAGVRILKTDVAWVGPGYSFGLNGVADVAKVMPEYGNNARPFIITLDGWAGTQRYAGLWSGDQTGGNWEYIRFHIPTYIGTGLSGQPNVSSDMDGIFGGKNVPVNVRDYQWKTFTPMELNMDGWGANEKYPQALGEPATSINRSYLKWKAVLMPYTYSIAREAVDGLPMVRAMFLDEANPYTLGKATQYQYMFGPYYLVAPIYQATAADAEGNDIRNGIYLPEGMWIDYYSGEHYKGGRIINNYDAPLWKQPLFVKAGAIVPLTHPHNNVNEIDPSIRIYDLYPYGKSNFTEYDDDGRTQAYLMGECVKTEISSNAKRSKAVISIAPTKGSFDGFVPNKSTEMRIYMNAAPKAVKATVGGKKVELKAAASATELIIGENMYFFDAQPELNKFSTPGSKTAEVSIKGAPRLIVKIAATDITQNAIEVTVDGYKFDETDPLVEKNGKLNAPAIAFTEENIEPYALTPTWELQPEADYYEIEFDGMLYSTIRNSKLRFEDLKAETEYTFRLRAVNASGTSKWAEAKVQTLSNPLEFAIPGIKAENSCKDQPGQGINKLFDYDEASIWHTDWGGGAVPFTMEIDLGGLNVLDKLEYLPREDGGNGTLLQGNICYSADRKSWSEPVEFKWAADGTVKNIAFDGKSSARYMKINVTAARGNFGSGREMYIFKVPGTETILQGDINHDGRVDKDDYTSYMNYTGLRAGDSDFDGYISGGDINKNGLIDAFDIATVGIAMHGGVKTYGMGTLAGTLDLVAPKSITKGEEVKVIIRANGLSEVNAWSVAIPYDATQLKYVKTVPTGTLEMDNLAYDRLHKNGDKALYPTFVNTGNKAVLSGSGNLVEITFIALQSGSLNLQMKDVLLVDKKMNTIEK